MFKAHVLVFILCTGVKQHIVENGQKCYVTMQERGQPGGMVSERCKRENRWNDDGMMWTISSVFYLWRKCSSRSTPPMGHLVGLSQLTDRVSLPRPCCSEWSGVECWQVAHFNLLKYSPPTAAPMSQWCQRDRYWCRRFTDRPGISAGARKLRLDAAIHQPLRDSRWEMDHMGLLPLQSGSGETTGAGCCFMV